MRRWKWLLGSVVFAAVVDVRALSRRPGAGVRGGGRVGGSPPLTPPRCVVPKLVGKPLADAWRRVVAAHCRLAKLAA